MYSDLMIDTATPERLRHLSQLHQRVALVHPQAAPATTSTGQQRVAHQDNIHED